MLKERLLSNWNISRVFYLLMGIFILVQSVMNAQWLGVLFGGYFSAMGLFALGCAAGNCYGGNCAIEPDQNQPVQSHGAENKSIS